MGSKHRTAVLAVAMAAGGAVLGGAWAGLAGPRLASSLGAGLMAWCAATLFSALELTLRRDRRTPVVALSLEPRALAREWLLLAFVVLAGHALLAWPESAVPFAGLDVRPFIAGGTGGFLGARGSVLGCALAAPHPGRPDCG